MKTAYPAIIVLMLWLGMAFMLSGCIRDDRDDCPQTQPGVRIVVRTLAEQTRSEGGDVIENVNIYIFDSNEYFVGSWHGDAYTHGERYEALLDLDPGRYHFVVWTNQGDIYNATYDTDREETTAEQLIVGIAARSGEITADLPDLHHGMLTDAEVIPDRENEFTIIIRPDTYRLNFSVEGLTPTAGEYRFAVRDNNSHYAFDNSVIEGMDHFDYVRTAGFQGAELTASMKVLRLTEDRTPRFSLSDIAKVRTLHEDDLVGMIKRAYESSGHRVDFDREFEFDIRLRFDVNMDVTVTVNGWSYTDNPTEL